MVIQFLCPACKQPIEVDDEWASRPVGCPYCHKAVTAPDESTLDKVVVPANVPPPMEPPDASPVTPELIHPTRSGKAIAGWALGLASAALVLYIAVTFLVTRHVLGSLGADPSPSDVEEAMRNITEQAERGEIPAWFGGAFAGLCAVFLLWAAGLVCAILGVIREQGRGMAIAALSICALMVAVFGLSVVIQML